MGDSAGLLARGMEQVTAQRRPENFGKSHILEQPAALLDMQHPHMQLVVIWR